VSNDQFIILIFVFLYFLNFNYRLKNFRSNHFQIVALVVVLYLIQKSYLIIFIGLLIKYPHFLNQYLGLDLKYFFQILNLLNQIFQKLQVLTNLTKVLLNYPIQFFICLTVYQRWLGLFNYGGYFYH